MKHKKIKEAETSLRFYRGIKCEESRYPTEFKDEFEKLRQFSNFKTVLETNEDKLHYKDFGKCFFNYYYNFPICVVFFYII